MQLTGTGKDGWMWWDIAMMWSRVYCMEKLMVRYFYICCVLYAVIIVVVVGMVSCLAHQYE